MTKPLTLETIYERIDELALGVVELADEFRRSPPQPSPFDWKTDLYKRLTSRPLWTAFLIPTIFAVIAACTGEVTWMQALTFITGGGVGFGIIEGGRDIAAATKGHQPAPAPATPPPHLEAGERRN